MPQEKPITRTPIKGESSNIKAFGYCSDRKCLDVEFTSGNTYRYHNVSPEEYSAMMKADETDGASLGKHFIAHIKSKNFTKL